MNTPTHTTTTRTEQGTTSTFAEDRWQGPSFAASWISPPTPRRYSEVDGDAATENDHA
jgi:hypothetical protein